MAGTPERTLLWSQEFGEQQDAHLDETVWNFDLGDGSAIGLPGWGNNELEFYTKESVTVEQNLLIKAHRLTSQTDLHCYYGPAQWSSGKIHTAKKIGFKYGLLEVRAKMPSGIGTWPAIWLLGANLLDGVTWPSCGEIDILENTGSHANAVQGTLHLDGLSGENGLTQIIQWSRPLADDFHTYAISWGEDSFEWFFNGVSYHKISKSDPAVVGKNWPFDQEFYLIINLAIGGWFAGEVDAELQAAVLEIEGIRYFSEGGVGSLILH